MRDREKVHPVFLSAFLLRSGLTELYYCGPFVSKRLRNFRDLNTDAKVERVCSLERCCYNSLSRQLHY